MDYEGLKAFFASLRAAFDDLTISRGVMVVEGDYVACQTTITGTFVREFTRSPVGPLPPNGSRVVFELMNIFRYDGQGTGGRVAPADLRMRVGSSVAFGTVLGLHSQPVAPKRGSVSCVAVCGLGGW